jgi:hypothetical protein
MQIRPISLRAILTVSLVRPHLQGFCFLQVSPPKFLRSFLLPLTCPMPCEFILLNVITLIIFDNRWAYKLCIPLRCHLLPIMSTYLSQHHALYALFVCPSPDVTYQFSHTYKTTGKTIVFVYVTIFMFLDSKREDKKFWTNDSRHFPNVMCSVRTNHTFKTSDFRRYALRKHLPY